MYPVPYRTLPTSVWDDMGYSVWWCAVMANGLPFPQWDWQSCTTLQEHDFHIKTGMLLVVLC